MSTLFTKYQKLMKLIKVKPKIRVVFIGQGKHAVTNLYPSLAYAGIELVASCTRDYKEVLKQVEVDAVIACVNAQVHYEIALSTNLPLFVEKPPASNSEQASYLMRLNKNIQVGFNKRFSTAIKEAKRLIPHPEFMTINVNVGSCRSERELLMEVGIHYADLFNYFGMPVRGQISDNLSWENATEHIEILGKDSLVVIDNGEFTHYQQNKISILRPNNIVPDIENHLLYRNGYIGELEHFAYCVANKKPLTPNIEDGYKALLEIEKML